MNDGRRGVIGGNGAIPWRGEEAFEEAGVILRGVEELLLAGNIRGSRLDPRIGLGLRGPDAGKV